MSTPLVPPRPGRTSQTTSTTKDSMPEVPPRPFRKLDPSPIRETRSPLNELPNPMGSLGLMGKKRSQNNLFTPEVPPRPSIQTIPSIGQEGSEYASFDQLPADAHGVESTKFDAPEQTRNVSSNMPLHAPKASVPQSTAKSRIETVTGTDSTQAAAMGIGKAKPADDVHKLAPDSSSSLSRVSTKADEITRVQTEPQLKTKTSFNRSTPSLHATSRPGSMFNEGNHEQGIPEIGMQIPLYPNAGDVQAPSPAPTQSQFTPGIGFFNDGSARAHSRRKSSRQEFGPPGSYGLHSHGQDPQDQFERDWIAKNPDRAVIEGYTAYGNQRPETALTSAELNKLVNQNLDVGMGTDPNMVSTPGEEVAWGATEEYMARYTSPKPSPLPTSEGQKRRSSSGNQPSAQSPLRKTSFPFSTKRRVSNEAVENDDGVVHVDAPERKWNKVTGGGEVDGTLDLGPRGGNTEERGGWFDEQGYGTPILASDEVLKRPGSAFMQPAVDLVETHDDYESDQYDTSRGNSRRNSLRVPSRPSSRPNSMHGEYQGGNLYRFISHDDHYGSGIHTPLEEIEEYEPLIPEGEEESPKPKPKSKKRPGLENHHFPSQDIWEDTPLSLQYSTTVDTPESPVETRAIPPAASKPATTFETPEQEQQRKDQNPNDMFSDNKTLIKPHLRDEMRPGMHRFPSQDIWEDTPDSMMGVTTVSGPQMVEDMSPPEDRPTTTAQDEGESRATTGFTQTRRPSVPARPLRKSKLAEELKPEEEHESTSRDISITTTEQPPSPDKSKRPAIPDRPKPSVPPRPAKKLSGESQADGLELSKSISPEETSSIPKAKPAVPARPAGEKIAALKAGFMNDLNNRLKLGPQGPPPKTKEVEPEAAEETTKAPLADARKGRAKGPARRKPAASPSAVEEKSTVTFSISSMVTLWEIDESDQVQVPSAEVTRPAAAVIQPAVSVTELTPETTEPEPAADAEVDLPKLAKEMAANEAHNTAEPTLGEPMSPEKAEAILSPPPELSNEEAGKADAVQIEAGETHGEMKSPVPDLGPSMLDVEVKESVPASADADAAVAATDHAVVEESKPTDTDGEVS